MFLKLMLSNYLCFFYQWTINFNEREWMTALQDMDPKGKVNSHRALPFAQQFYGYDHTKLLVAFQIATNMRAFKTWLASGQKHGATVSVQLQNRCRKRTQPSSFDRWVLSEGMFSLRQKRCCHFRRAHLLHIKLIANYYLVIHVCPCKN